MGNQLLIRAYDVGVGDCLYVGIPDGGDGFHILIDCGTISSIKLLRKALENLEDELLPDGSAAGKKRLDLLVATHRHKDHIKGFDPKHFKNIEIQDIWLSAAMDQNHPQAERTHSLHGFVAHSMREMESSGQALSPQLAMLASLYSISNDGAMDALRRDLPVKNKRRYVHAGQTSDELSLPLTGAKITVLGPERDIDGFYLGQEADESLRGLQEVQAAFAAQSRPVADALPKNISARDFRQLQSRMLSNALAFAETESSLQNNTSVVLLIEWRGRRLLFVGDAEWEGEFREGKHNGSWNVLWHKRRAHLEKPLDFLKIGHHGSFNATPWAGPEDPDHEVNQILDKILPASDAPTAKAVVSTQRTNVYEPIPRAEMLAELGKRVANTRRYRTELAGKNFDVETLPHFQAREEAWIDEPQPWRTDLEKILTGKEWVDVEIDPGE